jgi:hypothetical protein
MQERGIYTLDEAGKVESFTATWNAIKTEK